GMAGARQQEERRCRRRLQGRCLMEPIGLLGTWVDSSNIGKRANDLMRENWLILDECARMVNDGELSDPASLAECRELMGRALDIEHKYAATRAAEFAEYQRQWYVRAFGPNYESELEWT